MADKYELRDLAKKMARNGDAAATRVVVERNALKAIKDRWDLDDKAKRAGSKREWERISKDATVFRAEHDRLRGEFDKAVRDMLNPHKQSGGVEGEMLRQAAWKRLERVIEGSPSKVKFTVAQQALEQAAAAGDVHMIDVARRELGSYLSAVHGEKLPEQITTWLDLNGSSTAAADARLILMDVEEQLHRANLAVSQYTDNVGRNTFPDVMVSMTPGEVIYTDPDRDVNVR
jgi:hypothetical protein